MTAMAVRVLLLLLAFAWPVHAAEDWVQDVLGDYRGPVLNNGRIEQVWTDFELDAAGHLTGHYHVDDPDPFDGALTDFHADGEYSGSFTWHDRYGAGTVHIVFDPDHGRFTGRWGTDNPLPGYVFNGYRAGPRVGS